MSHITTSYLAVAWEAAWELPHPGTHLLRYVGYEVLVEEGMGVCSSAEYVIDVRLTESHFERMLNTFGASTVLASHESVAYQAVRQDPYE